MFTGAAAVGAVTAAVASRFIVGASSSGRAAAGTSSSAASGGSANGSTSAAVSLQPQESQEPQTTQASHPSPAIVPPAIEETVQADAATLDDLARQLAALQEQVAGIAVKLGVEVAPDAATRTGDGE